MLKKKSRREIEKMVDAKVKGKRATKVTQTDDANPESAEVDARISKLPLKEFVS